MKVTLYKWGSNEQMMDIDLEHVPAMGDYLLLNDKITPNWKNHYYIIRAVTHLLNSDLILHVEKYNPDEVEERASKIRDILEQRMRKQGDED
jgi:hypothetical protein